MRQDSEQKRKSLLKKQFSIEHANSNDLAIKVGIDLKEFNELECRYHNTILNPFSCQAQSVYRVSERQAKPDYAVAVFPTSSQNLPAKGR